MRPHPVQVGGAIPVPTAPGLGVEIDEAAVARHPPGNNIGIPVGESAGSYAPGTWREHVYVQSRLRRGRYLDPGRAS